MSKGRYLKAAERACSRKARFETAAAAVAFAQGRYGAYRCVVCGKYHLTSGRGDRPEPVEPPKKAPPGPKLGDLDWSAVTEPKTDFRSSTPNPSSSPDEARPPSQDPPRGGEEGSLRTARCAGSPGKDGRVLLVVRGKLTKSAPVERSLRGSLSEGTIVEIAEGDPPRVIRMV